MTKDEIVKVLIEQVVAMGFRIKLIALDAGFYTVEVINSYRSSTTLLEFPLVMSRSTRSLMVNMLRIVRGVVRMSRLSLG